MLKALWLLIKRYFDPVEIGKFSALGEERYYQLYPEARFPKFSFIKPAKKLLGFSDKLKIIDGLSL